MYNIPLQRTLTHVYTQKHTKLYKNMLLNERLLIKTYIPKNSKFKLHWFLLLRIFQAKFKYGVRWFHNKIVYQENFFQVGSQSKNLQVPLEHKNFNSSSSAVNQKPVDC